MRKLVAPVALTLLTGLGFYACDIPGASGTTGDVVGGGGGGGTLGNATVESNLPVVYLDEGSRAFTLLEINKHCSSGRVVSDSVNLNERYAIAGGQIYIWDDVSTGYTDCSADVLNGSSTRIIGTWSTSTLDQAAIPAVDRPSACTSDISGEPNYAQILFQSGTGTQTFSSTNMHQKITGKLCYGNYLAAALGYTSSGGNFTLIQSSCSSVKVRNTTTGDTAVFNSVYSGGRVSTTVNYAGKTCSGNDYFTAAMDCSKPDMSQFVSCMSDAGLFGTAAAKRAPAALHRRELFPF